MSSILAKYTFLPWLRQGISNQISQKENPVSYTGGPVERASILVDVALAADSNPSAAVVTRTVQLAGPGDVIGIQPSAILRMEPQPGVENFEPNYMPYVEFYEEDFPWRYTPAAPGTGPDENRMRPWLFLLVLDEDEFSLEDGRFHEPLPYLKLLNAAALPSITTGSAAENGALWAMAHVHVNKDINPGQSSDFDLCMDNLRSELNKNPDVAHSRLVSPRKLKANKNYTCFLIPAFEVGRQAGLGNDTANINAWQPSWGTALNTDNLFPFYHSWSFKSGNKGDFESLVRKLEPRNLLPSVGVRKLDIQDANDLLESTTTSEYVGLGGALKTKFTADYPFDPGTFQEALRDYLNLPATLAANGVTSKDPVVTPPLVGRWHATRTEAELPVNGWFDELNLDPGNRAAAGLGAQIVRDHQEEFMEFAWEQVGAVLEANRKIGFTELAKEVSCCLFERHIQTQSDEKLLMMTSSLHSKIIDTNTATTLFKNIKESTISRSGVSPTLYRMTRPGSKIRKRVAGANAGITTLLNDAELELVPSTTQVTNGTTTAMFLSDGVVSSIASQIGVANEVVDVHDSGDALPVEENVAQSLIDHISTYNDPTAEKTSINLGPTAQLVRDAMDPAVLMTSMLANQISVPDHLIGPSQTRIRPVMAHPIFPQPVYNFLKKVSDDHIIPNIEDVPDNTLALMIPNLAFIESFMAGLNHEMSRELLWREYPTDQRGTYFRQFWDKSTNPELVSTGNEIPEGLFDITPMDQWSASSALGSHEVEELGGQDTSAGVSPHVFLLIRGELLRKYPETIIYAQKAVWNLDTDGDPDPSVARSLDENGPIIYPKFSASIGNDITFFAFDLTVEEAQGSLDITDPGWFFALRERAGRVRFGLDTAEDYADTGDEPIDASKLSWGHISGPPLFEDMENLSLHGVQANIPKWGHNSADMANILFQEPVLIAVHGSDLLNLPI